MAIKGTMKPDHIPVNKYKLSLTGMIPIIFTKISGIEEETATVELPDKSIRSGGRSGPIEFDVEMPAHHVSEKMAMEGWLQEGKDPVSPFAYKTGTLQMYSQTGAQTVVYMLEEAICTKRSLPELDLSNDGEMAVIGFTIKANELVNL